MNNINTPIKRNSGLQAAEFHKVYNVNTTAHVQKIRRFQKLYLCVFSQRMRFFVRDCVWHSRIKC